MLLSLSQVAAMLVCPVYITLPWLGQSLVGAGQLPSSELVWIDQQGLSSSKNQQWYWFLFTAQHVQLWCNWASVTCFVSSFVAFTLLVRQQGK